MSDMNSRLHWNVAVIAGLRKTTRPVIGAARIVTEEELKEMDLAYRHGWTAQEMLELLQSRDQEAADRVRSTARLA